MDLDRIDYTIRQSELSKPCSKAFARRFTIAWSVQVFVPPNNVMSRENSEAPGLRQHGVQPCGPRAMEPEQEDGGIGSTVAPGSDCRIDSSSHALARSRTAATERRRYGVPFISRSSIPPT